MTTPRKVVTWPLRGAGPESRTQVRLHRLPEYVTRTHPHSTVSHRHTFDQVVYFATGARHMVDFEVYACAAGSLGWIPAGAVHHFEPEATGAGWLLNVDAAMTAPDVALSARRALSCGSRPFFTLTEPWKTRLPHLFELLHAEQATVDGVAEHLIRTLIALATRPLVGEQERRTTSPIAARFLDLIEVNFEAPLPVSAYARRLGVSPRVLHAVTQECFGRAPIQLANDRRTLEAKRLLRHSSLSVSEVGEVVGFEDPAHFSRFFTRRVGCSPRAFRDSGAT